MKKKSQYTQNLVIDHWIVTKEHIATLFQFFKTQFPQQDIILEGDTITYDNLQKRQFSDFDSFDNFVSKEVLGLKHELVAIKISTSYVDAGAYKYILGDIDFTASHAVFTIIAEGGPAVGTWVQDFYDSLKHLTDSLKPKKEQLELMAQEGKTYSVVLDYYGQTEVYLKTRR